MSLIMGLPRATSRAVMTSAGACTLTQNKSRPSNKVFRSLAHCRSSTIFDQEIQGRRAAALFLLSTP